ncbi:hypothetical protein PAXRUDRAFT_148075 [Paxillus rubicundulus Ve08.2h10]|uniref:Wax synthase domain-containing protein n=1 Tax=Paxillus rubicundulus Ve08.2h10 TaxID=930991 RepID=A0A0D0D5U5_9AGAM|nr:hypothetical protein PAXRUDRAFT_148075 [Paxillus rubicundulus Ve08.2h10]
MSFAALCLSDVFRIPSTRAPIDPTNFVSYVLPPVLSYFAFAVLAVTPKTHPIRVGLWPLVALLSLRAAISLDLSPGVPQHQHLNVELVALMFIITTRTIGWTLQKEPLKRYIRPAGATPSTIMDVFDLAANIRGYGWDWSKGLHVPHSTRPSAHTRFVACAILFAGLHAFMCGVFHIAVKAFSPDTFGSTIGGTIFDETLSSSIRYLRSSIITILITSVMYCLLQMGYNLCIIPAVLILRQDPAQWPPAFDRPWIATSVSDFWGRRWHQFFRQMFILGGYPLWLLFGRVGGIFGAFFASAIFHHISLITLNGQLELWRMIVSFEMMALGIIIERAFRQWTGRKASGLVGWVWTMAWLLLWGNLMTDGWARSGMFGFPSFVDRATPVRALVERLVMAFDAWLHTF